MYLRLEKKRALDALMLLIYFLAVISFTLWYQPGLLLGHVLYFILPGFYLTFRYWKENSWILIFGIALGVCMGSVLQVAATLNAVWIHNHIFQFLTWNGVPFEALAWYVMWIGFTACVYNAFFNRHHHRQISFCRSHPKFLLLCGAVSGATALFLFLHPEVFIIPHAYLIFGSGLVILPLILIFYFHPRIFKEVFTAAAFLSIFALIYEIVGLHVGWWQFPGEYLYTFPFAGVMIPLEEMLLWVALGSLCILAEFEELEGDAYTKR